jgi:DUF2075 family protein
MTDYKIEKFPFDSESIFFWGQAEQLGANWPVVYTLSNDKEIYVGETLSAVSRLNQHLSTATKKQLSMVQIILNERFNKSVCLDLESQLIRYLAADGTHLVLNANAGIQDANYFDRDKYQKSFNELFEMMVKDGLLSKSVPEIVNSNLFKFSPFKAVTLEQAAALNGIIERIVGDFKTAGESQLVVQGDPGTGKTIVAIYLMKLLRDIARASEDELLEDDSTFSEFFTPELSKLFGSLKIALVVPQQALRKTLEVVFSQTPGLNKDMVLTQFEVAECKEDFDLLIVDEAHRLGQRANQNSAGLNKKFTNINIALFGHDDKTKTQLDWIEAKSRHQLLLLDTAQSIRPGDLPVKTTKSIVERAKNSGSWFNLASQMRVMGGNDYLAFVKEVFTENAAPAKDFNGYDLRFFDSFTDMRSEILRLDAEYGLSRLLAGFAWEYKTKKRPELFDIELEGIKLRWNQTVTDWVSSPTSPQEVGSIHTIQGYDLNYAGVIIGNDIGYDPQLKKVILRRENYFDKKGKENNPVLGIEYSDEDVLHFVLNIYKVLLTRGIKGTFVYVCDLGLREFLRGKFPKGNSPLASH